MTKRKLKPFAVSIIYILSAIMLILSMYLIEGIIEKSVLKDTNTETKQEVINEDEEYITNIPVINTDTQIIRPYQDASVKIVQNYYDYTKDSTTQENSIIYYENTYIQNSGIDYAGDKEFDVVCILDGTVVSIKEDDILGTTVEIKHSNDLISIYQSLSNVLVSENETITQGTIIGTSGESNISPDLGNHLHFELYYQGIVVNPENYYGKLLGELE